MEKIIVSNNPPSIPETIQKACIPDKHLMINSVTFNNLLDALKPNSIHHIHYGPNDHLSIDQVSKIYSIIKEGGFISFEHSSNEFVSLLKASGFTKITDQAAGKPKWGSGASLKKPSAWASLKEETKVINEDTLLDEMTDKPLASASDCITKPKACANCSCGRKEEEESE